MLHFFLNIKANTIKYSHSTITNIECTGFHLDKYLDLNVNISKSQIISVGDYNTSIKYKFTKKRLLSSISNIIFVLNRGVGSWDDDYYPSNNHLKYAKKVIIIPNNDLTIISKFVIFFRSLKAINVQKSYRFLLHY